MRVFGLMLFGSLFCCALRVAAQTPRSRTNFDRDWRFKLGDDSLAKSPDFNDSQWRTLNLPHDWSIEGSFSKDNPTKQAEAGLPAGIGWYRKTFVIPSNQKNKEIFVYFEGIYHNSQVWINGHYLGERPNGYISFSYVLTPWLRFGGRNVIAVRVDNSDQPNSRWYTGSGIYRHVWLIGLNKTHFTQWGTFVTSPAIGRDKATLHIATTIDNAAGNMRLEVAVANEHGAMVASGDWPLPDTGAGKQVQVQRNLVIRRPQLWSVNKPYLYKVSLKIMKGSRVLDDYAVRTGIRSFKFGAANGFSLNGVPMKIKGVCLHHDLGPLGAAINKRAIERQLLLLKNMGCNAIRTSHNPPAPEFLDLCDSLGFLVMDEAFDVWKKKKVKHDYHEDWTAWHRRDLTDQVLRDRNHPSVFIWNIGNEIREQFDSTGTPIARELAGIVRGIDDTRPITSALTEADPKKNFIYQSGTLDLVGFNYHPELYPDFPKNYPGQKFIATETTSAEETRGFYDQPTDTTRHWPEGAKIPFTQGNPQYEVSAYDNVAAYWGSTHEATWKVIKKYKFLSGLFVWTGFDYLGEPTPYPWPARSSYFGIIDLAGFPKDVYYMYQSEWTNKPVLHLLPHWNWKPGQMVDVWAYYSQADEVELYLNGKSLGMRSKKGDDLHVSWRVKYEPGTLKAVSRKNGRVVLTEEIHTAGPAAKLVLVAGRKKLHADGRDLSFITVRIEDKEGNLVPDAQNLVHFRLSGPAFIAGVANGYQASLEPFKADYRKTFHGLCLGVIQSSGKKGVATITVSAKGLKSGKVTLLFGN